jgi:hypothetical protein
MTYCYATDLPKWYHSVSSTLNCIKHHYTDETDRYLFQLYKKMHFYEYQMICILQDEGPVKGRIALLFEEYTKNIKAELQSLRFSWHMAAITVPYRAKAWHIVNVLFHKDTAISNIYQYHVLLSENVYFKYKMV